MEKRGGKDGPGLVPVFHVPHDGNFFPEELTEDLCIPGELFFRYHEEMRDTDISLAVPEEYRSGALCCRFGISRLLCDVERFAGPEEIMERYGMGYCYEKVYDGTVIRRADERVRNKVLRYYWAHHARMDRICGRVPGILLVDLHSYSDRIVPRDFLREDMPLPDVCIGTDPAYTPPGLAETVRRRYAEAGFSAAFNYPYSGCYIPNAVMSGSCGTECAAVMLEHHRRICCDETGKTDPEKMAVIRNLVRQVIADYTGKG